MGKDIRGDKYIIFFWKAVESIHEYKGKKNEEGNGKRNWNDVEEGKGRGYYFLWE